MHPGQHIEPGRGVALVAGGLGRGEAFALFGQDVDQGRAGGAGVGGSEHGQQMVKVVAVDRADVGKAQLLEQGAADGHGFQHIPGPARAVLEGFGEEGDHALGGGLQFLKRVAGIDAAQIGRQRADRGGDGHLVVVQDDEKAFLQVARVVERLERHAGGHRTVTNDGHGVTGIAAKVGSDGETEGG